MQGLVCVEFDKNLWVERYHFYGDPIGHLCGSREHQQIELQLAVSDECPSRVHYMYKTSEC